ncbi:MAG TPA: methyltransferase domain-containing protein [Candidatus Aquilonibacter sp.]|nr:methyltransferase domain-containing protein [Candidatus Aquilonibacter sp.]
MRTLHPRTPLQLRGQDLELALTRTEAPPPAAVQHAKPQPNFDRVAAIYRWAEYISLGPLLQRTRTALLPNLEAQHRNPLHALVLGDGDGRFLEQLLLRYPDSSALAVDTSAAMLNRLRNRCARTIPDAATRLTTIQRSALEIDLPPSTSLITTHFLLDCFTQPGVDALIGRLATQLAPGALWLVSDFALPRNPLLRPVARLYIATLYTAFRVLTGLRVRRLPDPRRAFHCAGLRRVARQTFLCGLLYTELWRRE